MRHGMHEFPIEAIYAAVHGLAQPDRVAHDRLKDRLNVPLRLADHAEYLRGRSLLLQRLSKLTVTRFQFLEQPHVLDSDHGLVGKRLEKTDLRVSELAHVHTADGNGADRRALAKHGDRQRAQASSTHNRGKNLGVITCIGNVLCPTFEDRAPDRRSAARWHRVELLESIPLLFRSKGIRHDVDQLPVVAVYGRELGLAQPGRSAGDRLEYRLHVRW